VGEQQLDFVSEGFPYELAGLTESDADRLVANAGHESNSRSR
jgi:hypothetical protein